VFKGAFDTQLGLRPAKASQIDVVGGSDENGDTTRAKDADALLLVTDKQKDLDEYPPIKLQRTEVTIEGVFEVGGRPANSLLIDRRSTPYQSLTA